MHLSGAVKGVLVLAAVSAASPRVSWRQDITPFATCSYPKQYICSDNCTQLQLCTSDSDGGLSPTTVDTCDTSNGYKCSHSLKQCVPEASSDCHGAIIDFTCNDPGAYPDPYDCTVYHVCLEEDGTAEMGTCSDNWAYNPATYDCSLPISDPSCINGPIKGCQQPGYFDRLESNWAIYYICVRRDGVLYPDMHKCRHGQIFDLNIVGCRDRTPNDDVTTTTSQTWTTSF